MKQLYVTMLLLIMSLGMTFAQRTVVGTVTGDDGETLIGATVRVKGTNDGTRTDVDGKYSVKVNGGANTLLFSYTGFEQQEVTLGESNVVDVVLKSSSVLQDVVVTALGIKRESKALPYAAQSLNSEKLNTIRQTNVNNAISGKIAGIQVRGQSSAKLNGEPSIRIRGAGSLKDKAPLYVVDGTPLGAQAGNDLNPDDIENITVLKGPNATALYGQRGDAGVIIITTKKGQNRKGLGIELNQSTSLDMVYITPQFQNSYTGGGSDELIPFTWKTGMPEDWKALEGKYYHDYSDDASWGPRMVGQEYIPWYSWYPGSPYYLQTAKLEAQPNNIRDFFDRGLTTNSNINMTKAGDGYNVRLSYTNQGIKGVLPTSWLKKNVISTQSSFDLGSKFTAGANITYLTQKTNGDFNDAYSNNSSGSFGQWFHRDLNMDIIRELSDLKSPEGYLASWNHNNPNDYVGGGPQAFYAGNYWYNFFSYLDNQEFLSNRNRVSGDVNLTYKISPKFKVAGFLRRDQLERSFTNTVASIIEISGTQTGDKASYATGRNNDTETNYELLGTYTDHFGKLSFEGNLGGNISRRHIDFFSASTKDGLVIPDLFTLSNTKTANTPSNFRSEKEVRSVYARGSFGYNDFVYLDWSVRNDWSSALPESKNSYLYPSVGMSFVFSELMKSNILSYGKIRAGWAQVGSDLDPYSLALYYGLGTDKWDTYSTSSTPDVLVDPNIKPALSSSYEAGFDLKFLHNRLGTSFTYYKENKIDEILSVSIAGASGFRNKLINAGKVVRDGIELEITAVPVKLRKFQWELGLNFAKNNTVIDSLAEGVTQYLDENGTRFGNGVGVQLVHESHKQWGQIKGGAILKDANGNWILDAQGLPQLQADQLLGSVLPDFTGGFGNTFTYGNFMLNANFSFQKGGKFYSLSDQWGTFSGLTARTAEVNDKGNPVRDPISVGGGVHVTGVDADGNAVDTYVKAFDYFHAFGNRGIAEPHIHDLTFFKMTEVSLGYRFPLEKTRLSKSIQSLKLELIARNPWLMYSKTKDFDPSEISNRYGENAQYAGTRSFGFNISVGF